MSLAETRIVRSLSPARLPRRAPGARASFFALTLGLAAALIGATAFSVTEWTVPSVVLLALVSISAVWIAGGAATAIVGLSQPEPTRPTLPEDWCPRGRTAILVLLCGEDAVPLARYLAGLHHALDRLGLDRRMQVFVLSDTAGPDRIAAEEAALAGLIAAGRIVYRRRAANIGRKPGNIADWFRGHGDGFDYMAVLDADSRMSAWRLRDLVHRVESRPRLGLLQAGMRLLPGRTRFGRHQRVASRLLSPNFGRGMAAWAGEAGNYWGHNAILRVAAFRAAVELPRLSGRAPFGGPPLSHDFVEAAWIRRAGWTVELDPDLRGSAEDGPQTLAGFHRRDRRWCQGNLQHLRLISEPGLHPLSRLHLASGIVGYLAAPIWLGLVALVAAGAVGVAGALPLGLAATLLLMPKIAALRGWLARARSPARRRVVLRAAAGELLLSTLIAPLVMVRQTGAVASVLAGRDCGWTPVDGPGRRLPLGAAEGMAGLGLVALALLGGQPAAALWLAPVALPLVAAPLVLRALDRAA